MSHYFEPTNIVSNGNPIVPGDEVGNWVWHWDGKATIESTLVGTGTYAIAPANNTPAAFGTGAGLNGASGGRVQIGAFASGGAGKLQLLKIAGALNNIDANTSCYIFITDENIVGVPSPTLKHIGIRQSLGTVLFSTADGVTEQTTDITAFVSAAAEVFFDITYDGVTALCYVNGHLHGTHATNVPSSTAVLPIFRAYILNNFAATKTLYIDQIHAVFSD